MKTLLLLVVLLLVGCSGDRRLRPRPQRHVDTLWIYQTDTLIRILP